jgi:pyruvate/2-oxoglutarate dehydrogenase complex dihydrolipoamide acyltransferase (E2) component
LINYLFIYSFGYSYLKDADLKGLATIASDVKALASKARDGKLLPHGYNNELS